MHYEIYKTASRYTQVYGSEISLKIYMKYELIFANKNFNSTLVVRVLNVLYGNDLENGTSNGMVRAITLTI